MLTNLQNTIGPIIIPVAPSARHSDAQIGLPVHAEEKVQLCLRYCVMPHGLHETSGKSFISYGYNLGKGLPHETGRLELHATRHQDTSLRCETVSHHQNCKCGTFTKPRSAHCLNHDLTSAPMTEEERCEYLAQCWKDVTVEGNADT